MIDWLQFDNIWSFLFLVFLVVVIRAVVKYYEVRLQDEENTESKDETEEQETDTSEDETDESEGEEEPPLINGVFLQMSRSDLQSLAYNLNRLKQFQKMDDCSSGGRSIIVDNLDFAELKDEIPEMIALINRENSS